MPKTPPPDFKIHVDSSCLTDSTDLVMAPDRATSSETIIHHDPPSEEQFVDDEVVAEENNRENDQEDLDEDAESDFSDPTTSQLARERQIDRIEAQIQAAARAVVASIEQDNYHGEDSILDAQTDEGYDEHSQVTYDDGTELTYDGTEGTYESEDEHNEQDGEGDSSSHHDGDIDDDVFSHSDHSGRSSLNSIHDLQIADEMHGKELTSPAVGEEAATEPVSRIPSDTSFTPRDSTPVTPSRVLSRPPFRRPSSVRAMQMSSPTPSIFSSPRSMKRHLPTVSRLGTPNSRFSSPSKKTPTRFKAQERPLVLLHVTLLPLSWTYSHIISSPDLPPTLQGVKDNWRLLQDRLEDTVLQRGVLLAHPQDSYEVLEERLLEALELPVRPRARILKCGHYMGPETPSSSSEDEGREQYFQDDERKWCDICGRDVKIEGVLDGKGEQRFRIKIYASNGLMRAGAWAACWREMEGCDVEIEPFVEGGLAVELEHMALSASLLPRVEAEVGDDGFVDEDEPLLPPNIATPATEHTRRKMMNEERMREIYGPDTPLTPLPMGQPRHRSTSVVNGDSLPELLVAAFKVAMRDKKNVAIFLLSILVLLLALRSGSNSTPAPNAIVQTSAAVPALVETALPVEHSFPAKIAGVIQSVEKPVLVPKVEIASQAVEASSGTPPTPESAIGVKATSFEPSAIPPPLVVNIALDSDAEKQVVVNAGKDIHHTPEGKQKEEIPI